MRALLALALLLLLLGCSSARPAPVITPTPPPARPASCAWYTATSQPGQVVNVTATGPACTDRSLIDWLTSDSDRPWTSEGVIPGSFGTPLGTLTRNGSSVVVWFTGPASGQAGPLAGRLADALQAAGWRPAD